MRLFRIVLAGGSATFENDFRSHYEPRRPS